VFLRRHGENSTRLFTQAGPRYTLAPVSILSRWFGKKPEEAPPRSLRSRVFDAAATDPTLFRELCSKHRVEILAAFGEWAVVPLQVREGGDVPRYAHGLISVARHFAEVLGEPAPLERLRPAASQNPISAWQEALTQAQAEMEALRYDEARERLLAACAKAEGLSGTAVERYLPVTLGHIGQCWFQQGQAERALEPTLRALDLCQKQADHAGVMAYLRNAYEICRYLGNAQRAADYASTISQTSQDASERRWFAKQALVVRAGEPLNRVVAVIAGQRYELGEFDRAPPAGAKSVQFEFERNRISLRPACELTARGERLAGEGCYERALSLFRAAAAADPFDPHSRYLEGLTLLHLKRPAEAIACYEACEMRAPGWFQCRTDRWVSEQLAADRLDHAAFLALIELEDGTRSVSARIEFVRRALSRYPKLAPLQLALGKLLGSEQDAVGAESALRAGLTCAEEPDVTTRLLANLAATLGPCHEQRGLLQQALELQGNLVSAAMAQWMLSTLPKN
jgi:tetratricopeptide (TPR) repeat protein